MITDRIILFPYYIMDEIAVFLDKPDNIIYDLDTHFFIKYLKT